jgi:nucleoside-diphosphate-sugar epimerase
MKVLFIGGTGNISTAVSKRCIDLELDLFLLNRGSGDLPTGSNHIQADINNTKQVQDAIENHTWDVVVNWIAFTEEEVLRDIQLFKGKTGQYIFISSASAYQKPPSNYIITESTPLHNPFWKYSQDKIACEERLMIAFRESRFPVTIVRPSHTYDTVIPVVYGGWQEYTIIDRIKKGQKIIVHGDGTSLWTLTHSEDFAKGFCGLIGNPKAIGESFHITSDEVFNWNQIYNIVAEAAGREPKIVHISSDFIIKVVPEHRGRLLGDKSESAVFDNSKIKSFVPDYKSTIPFREGIKRTLAWFEEDPKRQLIRETTVEMLDRIIEKYENLGISK